MNGLSQARNIGANCAHMQWLRSKFVVASAWFVIGHKLSAIHWIVVSGVIAFNVLVRLVKHLNCIFRGGMAIIYYFTQAHILQDALHTLYLGLGWRAAEPFLHKGGGGGGGVRCRREGPEKLNVFSILEHVPSPPFIPRSPYATKGPIFTMLPSRSILQLITMYILQIIEMLSKALS